MSAKIVPFRANSPSAEALQARVRELSADSANIDFEQPHCKARLAQRGLTMRQLLETLRKGDAVGQPKLDEWGDWRLKLRRYVAGRRVQVVVAVKEDHIVVVTAI